jgi:branched-chain amino acid transport system ATP-binding protein
MLEVRGLEVSYGPVQALKGVDVRVGDGEVVGLIGPNGAGKTSLLRAISHLVAYEGSVEFDGVDLRRVAPEARARRGLIHVPEGRHVFPDLTVHENLQMGLVARHGRSGHTIAQVYELFPALAELRNRDGWMLSGGEQQMLAIGRALVAAPRLLLLDEPSLGLSPRITRAVFSALEEIAAQTPLLVVEQNTAMALELCARAYVLVGGEVVLAGTAEEVGHRQSLLDSFLGQRGAHDVQGGAEATTRAGSSARPNGR